MFKCADCGHEFKTKPDFCDCGNNVFEEVVTEKPLSILEKYEISVFVLSFFVLCLVLSVLTIFCFWNPKPQAQTKQPQVLKPVKNIPNIDSFWDNTAVKVVAPEPEPVAPIIQKIIPIMSPKPKAQKSVQKKVEPKPVVKKQETKPVTQPKPVVKQEAPVRVVQKVQTPAKPVVSQEVLNYKLRLRNTLFSKLDYSKLVGQGKCGIQFAVNAEGKLINRGFTFQSDNTVINDEIYKMIMRMPTFNPPPSEYKGELIKFVFEFDNGRYEVTFGE